MDFLEMDKVLGRYLKTWIIKANAQDNLEVTEKSELQLGNVRLSNSFNSEEEKKQGCQKVI